MIWFQLRRGQKVLINKNKKRKRKKIYKKRRVKRKK